MDFKRGMISAGRAHSRHRCADRLVRVAGIDRAGAGAAKLLHSVDQPGDPVDLSGDHPCKFLVSIGQLAFNQLPCPPDRGERVLDFMRQHSRSAQNCLGIG